MKQIEILKGIWKQFPQFDLLMNIFGICVYIWQKLLYIINNNINYLAKIIIYNMDWKIII